MVSDPSLRFIDSGRCVPVAATVPAESTRQCQAQKFRDALGRVRGHPTQLHETVPESVQVDTRVWEVLLQARAHESVAQCCGRVSGRVPAAAVERRPRGSVAPSVGSFDISGRSPRGGQRPPRTGSGTARRSGRSWPIVALAWLQGRKTQSELAEQARVQREATELAHRQTEAVERRAYAGEQMLEQLITTHGLQSDLSAPQPSPSSIQRTLEWRGKHLYLLRNVGRGTATGGASRPLQHPVHRIQPPRRCSCAPRRVRGVPHGSGDGGTPAGRGLGVMGWRRSCGRTCSELTDQRAGIRVPVRGLALRELRTVPSVSPRPSHSTTAVLCGLSALLRSDGRVRRPLCAVSRDGAAHGAPGSAGSGAAACGASAVDQSPLAGRIAAPWTRPRSHSAADHAGGEADVELSAHLTIRVGNDVARVGVRAHEPGDLYVQTRFLFHLADGRSRE